MADDERSDEDRARRERKRGAERRPPDESEEPSGEDESADSEESKEGTQPGDWERKPADEEDLRHDDSSEPLAEPLGDDADDDLAEQEAGDVTAGDDEDFDRPEPSDETDVDEAGSALGRHAEPLLGGSEVSTPLGGIPMLSIAGIVAMVVVFCVAFFVVWALIDGSLGIFLGILAGTALGMGAMKLLAMRAE